MRWTPVRPLNGITPFTYRDGLTYLEVLEDLRNSISDGIIPDVNSILGELVENINDSNSQYAQEIEELVNSIANRSPDFPDVTITLTEDYTLMIDPLWPTERSLRVRVSQDSIGGHTLSFDPRITSHVSLPVTPLYEADIVISHDTSGNWVASEIVTSQSLEFNVNQL